MITKGFKFVWNAFLWTLGAIAAVLAAIWATAMICGFLVCLI